MPPRLDPSLKLPPELLMEIFHLCDPDFANRDIYARGIFLMRELPWVLTHVCRRWRQLALSTPQLWRYLDVNISLLGTGLLPLVSLLLERSSPCPIMLRLTGFESQYNTSVVERLIGTSHRWEHLTLLGPVTIVDALEPVRGKLPQLRRLDSDTHVSIVERGGESPRIIDLFADAPCLHHAVTPHRYRVSYVLPWQQLKVYRGPMLTSLKSTLKRLDTFSNLVTLHMSSHESRYLPTTTAYPFVHLPHLRTLLLRTWSSHPGDVLIHLHLPALISLTLDCPSPDICTAITSLLDRSRCALESLTFEVDESIDTALIPVLASTPQLRHLVLGAAHFAGNLLIALTPSASGDRESIVAPHLETLELRDGKFNQNLLWEMVEARFAMGEGALKRLGFSLDVRDIEHELVRRMDVLIALGFTVERL